MKNTTPSAAATISWRRSLSSACCGVTNAPFWTSSSSERSMSPETTAAMLVPMLRTSKMVTS